MEMPEFDEGSDSDEAFLRAGLSLNYRGMSGRAALALTRDGDQTRQGRGYQGEGLRWKGAFGHGGSV
jgi:hypothetical protein